MNAVAIANNDVAIIAWDPAGPIDNCLGFAVYRTDLGSGQTVPLESWVGFQGQSNPDWKPRSTEVWPVQEFHWKDLEAAWGGSYQYKVVPMIGTPGNLKPHPTISWESNPVHVTPDRGGVLAYFNRGILSTQAMAHRLPKGTDTTMYKALKGRIDQPGDPLRNQLAGQLILALRSLLDRARQESGQCYAALYELTDPELEQSLIGNPAVHLVLSTAGKNDSENRPARQALTESHIDLINRMLPDGHIGHNKSMVYVRLERYTEGRPEREHQLDVHRTVRQSNNALIVEDDQVAAAYFDYWKRLKADTLAAGDNPNRLQSPAFRTANQTPHDVTLSDGSSVRIWFSPNTKAKSKTKTSPTPVNLQDVFSRIAAARQAVLFLVFQPGEPSIIDAIARAQAANPSLFVRGAVTDPKAAGEFNTQLFNLSGIKPDAEVVPATAVKSQFSFWEHELLKDPQGFTIIHDKIIVIDPFSADSVVVTGSHNLGYASSYNNDENLLIFSGQTALAQAYAAHVLDVYDHYRFRYQVEQQGDKAWSGLSTTPDWQPPFFQAGSDLAKLTAFWQAGISFVSSTAGASAAPGSRAPGGSTGPKSKPGKRTKTKTAPSTHKKAPTQHSGKVRG